MFFDQVDECVKTFAFREDGSCIVLAATAFTIVNGCVFFYQFTAFDSSVRKQQQSVVLRRNNQQQFFDFIHQRAADIEQIICLHIAELVNQDFIRIGRRQCCADICNTGFNNGLAQNVQLVFDCLILFLTCIDLIKQIIRTCRVAVAQNSQQIMFFVIIQQRTLACLKIYPEHAFIFFYFI